MATKVVIIDIDLGLSVNDIINEEIEDLTGAAIKELDNALEIAKATQRVKLEKEAAARETDTKLNDAMEEAFKNLVEAGAAGLPVSAVMNTVASVVPNSSAFTLRMKGILSQKGNPYFLERQKVHGTPHYVFIPFNSRLLPETIPTADDSQ